MRWNQNSLMNHDLLLGLRAWPTWTMLAENDIRQRYRRSVLGPWWITISTGILIIVLGLIYSRVFKIQIDVYIPYLAVGFIIWGYIATTLVESCLALQEGERIIKQISVPVSVFLFRVTWRNLIVLLHTAILFFPISLYFGLVPSYGILKVVPGFIVVYLNQLWLGTVLALLSTRFRDVPQIVASVIQIATFATPIMWHLSDLGDQTLIADINPIYHLIELVRAPLLGGSASQLSWIVGIGMAIAGFTITLWLMRRVAGRIVFWL
jgi:ABC-type polysaccharide/polyol phosphate export permease